MSLSPNLSLPFIQPAQAQKHVTHNAALERLDALVHLSVTDLYAVWPPEAPSEGMTVGIGAQARGAFAGRDGQIACFSNGGWLYLGPKEGMRAWNEASGALHVRQGDTWVKLITGTLANLDGVGVRAAYDDTNRLSVAAPATLLSHAGGGHQLKINKAATGETASLVYQTGFSGRAEMGLAGNDDFSVKVSPDGARFHEGLRIRAEGGAVSAPAGLDGVQAVVSADAALLIETPAAGGFAFFSVVDPSGTMPDAAAVLVYATGAAPRLIDVHSGPLVNVVEGPLDGDTGPAGAMNLSARAGGHLQIENRTGAARQICLTWTNGYRPL